MEFNGEPLVLGMRRWAGQTEYGSAVRSLLLMGADRIEELEAKQVLTALEVRRWLRVKGLDVHPRQKKKLNDLCQDEMTAGDVL